METKQEKEDIKQRVREQTTGYIATALGLVAGLAWNEAIKGLIDSIYPAANGGGLGAKFIYAIIVTIGIVIVSSYLIRFSQKKNG